jgi:hypothetical protein
MIRECAVVHGLKIWIGQMHQLRRSQSQELLRSDHPTKPEPGIQGGLESSEIRGP